MPTWPGADEHGRRVFASHRAPSGYVSATVFGISLGVNAVLLIGLLGVLLLSHAGAFSPGGASGQSSSGLALGSATATSTAAASPTPSEGWLRVAPSSVQLGCDGDQRTQFVTLENTGPETVRWQVAFSVPEKQAGVAVSPQHGALAAGASMPIQIQNNTSDSGSVGGSNSQGDIGFAPTMQGAGAPASLSYTATSCQ